MYFDPLYLLFMVPALLFSLWASWRTKSAFNKYQRVRTARGVTGAQAAGEMLRSAGINDVQIVQAQGFLSDHYNPTNKTLALSEGVYGSSSIAAVGVACHEAGHAIQHANHYAPLHFRSALVPTAGFGSTAGYIVALGGMFFHSPNLILVGAALISLVLLFQVVTLPVEFDASNRAKQLAVANGIVLPQEREGMDRVLNAAAMTYVAAVVSTLLTIAYYLLRASGMRRD